MFCFEFEPYEVRGYTVTTAEYRQQLMDANYEQETLRELNQKKQSLLLELANYEQAKKLSEMGGPQQAQALANQDIACIAVSGYTTFGIEIFLRGIIGLFIRGEKLSQTICLDTLLKSCSLTIIAFRFQSIKYRRIHV